MPSKSSALAKDFLPLESRQMRQQGKPTKQHPLSTSANDFNTDDEYDYYDYGVLGSGGRPKFSTLSLNKNRKSFQQRRGSAKMGVSATSALGSFSGHHAGGYGDEYCDNGISFALLLTAILGVAVMFWVLFTKITMAGRRRRSVHENQGLNDYMSFVETFEDLIYNGLEEFENKVDQIAAGNDESSWIGKLYKKFSADFGGANNTLSPEQMDGMEPPMLVETWGLEDVQTLFSNNSSTESPNFLNNSTRIIEDVSSLIHRTTGNFFNPTDDDDDMKYLVGDQKCNTKFWRCIGTVLQDGLHYLQEPGGITGAINRHLFNLAFHGGFGNVWGALMSIPEARHVKKCMNDKDECLSFEIIRKEANVTYAENPRIIVNPDFVESLDNSDGAVEFDPDDQKKYDEAMEDNEIGY